MEADELIRIFVRDGEKVFVITADKDTSGAERLFPSFEEISKLFSQRHGWGSDSREITPDVVDDGCQPSFGVCYIGGKSS